MTEAPNHEREAGRNKRFVVGVWALLGALTVTYLYSHFCRPPSKAPELTTLAGLTSDGELEIRDRSSLNWYLGPDHVASIEADARARSNQMRRLREDLESRFGEVRRRTLESNPAERDRFLAALQAGNYTEAYRSFERLLVSLSGETRNLLIGPGLVFEMREKLREITDHRKAQQGALLALQPVVTSSFVWGDPDLLLLDVFFWALFGVLIHLLWSSSESFGKAGAGPDHIASLAKLLYGPVLAIGVAHALSSIFSPVLGFGLRLWLFPTIGLVLGLMSSSIVAYIDRLAERIRGRASKPSERDAVVATAVAATAVARQTAAEASHELEQAPVAVAEPEVETMAAVEPPAPEIAPERDVELFVELDEEDEPWQIADEEFDRAIEAAVELGEDAPAHDRHEPLEGEFGGGDDDAEDEEPVEEPALRPAATDTGERSLAALREAMRPRDFDELRRLAKELAELTLRARIEEGEAKV